MPSWTTCHVPLTLPLPPTLCLNHATPSRQPPTPPPLPTPPHWGLGGVMGWGGGRNPYPHTSQLSLGRWDSPAPPATVTPMLAAALTPTVNPKYSYYCKPQATSRALRVVSPPSLPVVRCTPTTAAQATAQATALAAATTHRSGWGRLQPYSSFFGSRSSTSDHQQTGW